MIASINIPLFLRPYIYRFYAYYFKADLEEVELPLH
jgi:phosphatidylserine decarboxylase